MKQKLYKYNVDIWVRKVWTSVFGADHSSRSYAGKSKATEDVRKESHLVNFMAGMTGGVLASVVVNPMDVAKTRLQTDTYLRDATRTWEPPLHHLPIPLSTQVDSQEKLGRQNACVERKYTGLLSALRLMVKEEGTAALMKGVLPRIMFFAPLAGMQYSIYELAKQLAQVSDAELKVSSTPTHHAFLLLHSNACPVPVRQEDSMNRAKKFLGLLQKQAASFVVECGVHCKQG